MALSPRNRFDDGCSETAEKARRYKALDLERCSLRALPHVTLASRIFRGCAEPRLTWITLSLTTSIRETSP